MKDLMNREYERTMLARVEDEVIHYNGSTGMYEVRGMEFVSDVEAVEYIEEGGFEDEL